ncbi:MAG: hypothetical protein ACK4SY_00900 [Pyrobaculum sp.]
MDLCITSGWRGGTGKSTYTSVLGHIWRDAFGLAIRLSTPLDRTRGGGINVVDFPTFQTTDEIYLERLARCAAVIYVVDEDIESLRAVEVLHPITKREVWGVVVNKVVGKPNRIFLGAYRRFGQVYVVHFDIKLALHKSVGVPPYKARSPAVLEMARSAVDILKRHKSISAL